MHLGRCRRITVEPPERGEGMIGYRTWNVLPGGELVATSYGVLWRPGINKAHCYYAHRTGLGRPAHSAPAQDCRCGFYGLYARESRGCLGGLIAVWGDVWLHPTGFRAEYAQIIAVDADYLPAYQLSGMRSFYGPTLLVCGGNELEGIAESGEYGRLLSKEQGTRASVA